jgi:purine-binding chemotaxis protein CheW
MRSMSAESEEVLAALEQREQDHINRRDELGSSVHANGAFRLTTDPHACKFGAWYDAPMASAPAVQRFTNGGGPLEGVLRAFERPHRRIHSIAVGVARLMESGEHHGALGVTPHARNGDRAMMVGLLDRAKDLFVARRRTPLLILEHRGERIGGLIDQVRNTRALLPQHMQSVSVDSRAVGGMSLPSSAESPVAVISGGGGAVRVGQIGRDAGRGIGVRNKNPPRRVGAEGGSTGLDYHGTGSRVRRLGRSV